MSAIISILILFIIEVFSINNNLEIKLNTINENINVGAIQEKIIINNEKGWSIEIPKINLIAPIHEGTTKEVLDLYVGHFNQTPTYDGNICLAAHNRGYNVNYFQNIKDLEIGDQIYYQINNIKRIFEVESKTIIKETDWSMLENTKENKITLITCVEDMPEYRRCIQAIEREEK